MFDNGILTAGLILWGSQYLLAWALGSLTPSQMRAGTYANDSILPLIWHGGIWYDLVLTFWLSYLAKQHPEWSEWQWTFALALGFAASWFMHFKVYAPATIP